MPISRESGKRLSVWLESPAFFAFLWFLNFIVLSEAAIQQSTAKVVTGPIALLVGGFCVLCLLAALYWSDLRGFRLERCQALRVLAVPFLLMTYGSSKTVRALDSALMWGIALACQLGFLILILEFSKASRTPQDSGATE
jgi:hypothetical protein